MVISGDSQPSPSGPPLVAGHRRRQQRHHRFVLQDHQVAWIVLAAFSAWLAHNVVITWIKYKTPSNRG